MRGAAGIILIILGMIGLIGLVVGFSHSGTDLSFLPAVLWRIGSGAFFVAGGVFCLKRRYWGLCRASALFALFIGISSTIDYLRHIATGRMGPLSDGPVFMVWGIWIMVGAAIVSTILILLAKKRWQRTEASPDFSDGQHLSGPS
jgi:hypothetical protein